MTPGVIALSVVGYLILSRCIIGFFYAATEGVNIAKSANKAAFLVPPFGELVLLMGVIHFLIYQPVVKVSNLGIKVNKWREDKLVNERVLEKQRQAYELKPAQFGLKPEDIPSYIEEGDLESYVKAQQEAGLVPEPVDVAAIRKTVRKEMRGRAKA